jgi:hypothetical protein
MDLEPDCLDSHLRPVIISTVLHLFVAFPLNLQSRGDSYSIAAGIIALKSGQKAILACFLCFRFYHIINTKKILK